MTGYSADVRLTLTVGEIRLPLSHVGPKEVIVRKLAKPLPPCEGVLTIEVDDHVTTDLIYLPDGIPAQGVPVRWEKR